MGRPATRLALSDDEIVAAYESGLSMLQIARQCGVKSQNPVARVLRGSGATIRKPGEWSPHRVSNKEQRVCGAEGCSNTFSVYPSQNKRYCSPECRWPSPRERALVKPQVAKHQVSIVDPNERRGQCSICGPVDVRQHKGGWRCNNLTRVYRWAKQYGLSADDVADMLEAQGGRCGICRETLTKRWAVDHCHTTGVVRGLLCSQCNLALGLMSDDTSRLTNAIHYLRGDKPWEQ